MVKLLCYTLYISKFWVVVYMVKINKNTFVSELYAYLMLKDNLFKYKDVVIGDDIPNGLPDIYTVDKKIGVEVTCVEEKHVYNLLHSLFKDVTTNKNGLNLKTESFDSVNMKFAENRLKNANLKNKIRLNTNSTLKAQKESTKEGITNALNYVVNKKLNRLNNSAGYSGCKNIFLFLVSDHITKKHVNVNDYRSIYLKLCKKYNKKFDGVFVALNDKLYFIDKQNKINVIMKPNEVREMRKETKFKHLEQNMEIGF